MGHSARTGAKIRRLGEFREGRSKVRERERERRKKRRRAIQEDWLVHVCIEGSETFVITASLPTICCTIHNVLFECSHLQYSQGELAALCCLAILGRRTS